jgi:hypothetical protein
MIRTENVLPFAIKRFFVVNPEGKSNENIQQSCPQPVDPANEFKLVPEKNRNEQQGKKQKKKYCKNHNAISRVNAPDEFHGVKNIFLNRPDNFNCIVI